MLKKKRERERVIVTHGASKTPSFAGSWTLPVDYHGHCQKKEKKRKEPLSEANTSVLILYIHITNIRVSTCVNARGDFHVVAKLRPRHLQFPHISERIFARRRSTRCSTMRPRLVGQICGPRPSQRGPRFTSSFP